ncbi:Aldo/keto reductase [Akanthomyces lecanii RCEF 1005]|uniref:Aldo/keto reductase n=1 Tax=Akanthomyces lecanii RCEF 1005 TaxID=1081108 RepID=A0A168GG92_CORDF|nr:Aldo/keto reductase [Akanthomyces lecanii RCEF 1005]
MSQSTNFPIGAEGATIPAVGFGTFQPDSNPEAGVTEAVLRALKAGYRHIDTAWMYGNGEAERGVGEALRKWNGKREDIFIVTKLANAHHKPADVAAALELSLKNLGVDYVDLYLMHTPVAYERVGEGENEWLTARFPDGKPKLDMPTTQRYDLTWTAMEQLVKAGKAKHIGVSNFSVKKLQKVLRTCKIKPAANQVEVHPFLLETDLIQFCNENGIHVTAFSPLGGKPVAAVAANADVPGPLQHEVVKSIAEKHSMSPGQVLLKWGLQRGTSVIPKAYTPSHIADNFAVLELPDLTKQDCTAIDEIRKEHGEVRFINYLSHWGFDIYSPGPEDPTEEPEILS